MLQAILKMFRKELSKKHILELSHRTFRVACQEITGDKSHVLWAKHFFDERVMSGDLSLEQADLFLKDKRNVRLYVQTIGQDREKSYQEELKSAIAGVNSNIILLQKENSELKVQNEQLLAKNEVLREEGARAGRWATRLSLGLFAASVCVSLYASPISKMLGIDEDKVKETNTFNIQKIDRFYNLCPDVLPRDGGRKNDEPLRPSNQNLQQMIRKEDELILKIAP